MNDRYKGLDINHPKFFIRSLLREANDEIGCELVDDIIDNAPSCLLPEILNLYGLKQEDLTDRGQHLAGIIWLAYRMQAKNMAIDALMEQDPALFLKMFHSDDPDIEPVMCKISEFS